MERIKKVNELIKRELGKIILEEVNFDQEVLVTLTEARTSVDFSVVKIHISVVPEKEKKNVIKKLKGNIWEIQQDLNKKLEMKKVPKIVFVESEMSKKAARIEEILKKIKEEELK